MSALGKSDFENNFVLVYKHAVDDGDGKLEKYKMFHFDNLIHLHADLGMGLYTEGTGNLAYVKGATNPVKLVVSQSLTYPSVDGSSTEFTTGEVKSTVSINAETDTDGKIVSTNKIHTASAPQKVNITPKANINAGFSKRSASVSKFTDYNDDANFLSVFEWAAIINAGQVEKSTVVIYSKKAKYENDDKRVASKEFSIVFELSGAIPIVAQIKRNPYRGKNKAELTFVADAIKVNGTGKF